jgi:hypothetical protein
MTDQHFLNHWWRQGNIMEPEKFTANSLGSEIPFLSHRKDNALNLLGDLTGW